MLHSITTLDFARFALGEACFAGAIVAAALAIVWACADLRARFDATLQDQGDQGADWGSEGFHDNDAGAA